MGDVPMFQFSCQSYRGTESLNIYVNCGKLAYLLEGVWELHRRRWFYEDRVVGNHPSQNQHHSGSTAESEPEVKTTKKL